MICSSGLCALYTFYKWGLCCLDMYVVCPLHVLAPDDSIAESSSGEVLSNTMWIRHVNKSLLYLFNIQKHVPLGVPDKDKARWLGDLVLHGEGGPWPLTFVCLFFLQEDEVVLQCIANVHKEQRKFCLAAEGLGNRLCFLEPTSEAKVRLITCPAPSPLVSQAVI